MCHSLPGMGSSGSQKQSPGHDTCAVQANACEGGCGVLPASSELECKLRCKNREAACRKLPGFTR